MSRIREAHHQKQNLRGQTRNARKRRKRKQRLVCGVGEYQRFCLSLKAKYITHGLKHVYSTAGVFSGSSSLATF